MSESSKKKSKRKYSQSLGISDEVASDLDRLVEIYGVDALIKFVKEHKEEGLVKERREEGESSILLSRSPSISSLSLSSIEGENIKSKKSKNTTKKKKKRGGKTKKKK